MTEAELAPRSMRIVIGCDTFPPDINGASRFAERLASGLVRAGHEVHVIAPAYGKKCGTFTEIHDSSPMTVHRLKSYRVVQHKTLRYVWPFTVKSKTDRILRELSPDAVHINSHMLVGRFLLNSAKEQGIRVIATNHIMPENLIKYSLVIPRWAEKIAMSLAWKDAGRVLRKADVVTTPTRKAANLLENASGLTGVLAVSCGIEASKFANNTPTTNDKPRILYLGRLDYEKHIHNLIRAVALLPESLKVKVEIVGDGGEREYLEKLSKELRLSRTVSFRGHIKDEELPGVYEQATVFAMPSIAELQSIATMEAMASGRPVVAADAMALPHLVHDGDNGYLFPPDDVKAFADRLLRVLTADQEELDRLSENSLHLIQSHDIDRTIKIFEGLYRGQAQDMSETADNLATYSLPIGSLSKTLSRSIALARKRSAKIRERAERARDKFMARAESAGNEVKDRLEGVREEVSFAAVRLDLRIRKRVRKAADRLRFEELRDFESRTSRDLGVSVIDQEGQLPQQVPNEGEQPQQVPNEGEQPQQVPNEGEQPQQVPSEGEQPQQVPNEGEPPLVLVSPQRLRAIHRVKDFLGRAVSKLKISLDALGAWLRSSQLALTRYLRIKSQQFEVMRRDRRLRLAGQRVSRLKLRHSKLRKRINTASKQLALMTAISVVDDLEVTEAPIASNNEMRRALVSRIIDEILISVGVLIAVFVVWFLLINDPVQGARQEESARSLVQEWRDQAGISTNESVAVSPSLELPPVLNPPGNGVAFAALYVPRFGSDFVRVIAEGTDLESVLNSRTRGVGRYKESDPLGSIGNFALAAHRTTWGAAFGEIGELRIGDKIYIETVEGWYVYGYRNTEYVWETEVDVLNSFPKMNEEPVGSRIITLTSCHPKFSEAERVIAYGIFEGWYPREAGAPSELAEMIEGAG